MLQVYSGTLNEQASWSVDEAWDSQQMGAVESDERRLRNDHSTILLLLGVLVAAARASTLHRFFPFTSHDVLCMSSGPEWYRADPSGEVAPAFIARAAGESYVVYSGSPYSEDFYPVLSAASAEEAVAEMERLLVDWPPSSQIST